MIIYFPLEFEKWSSFIAIWQRGQPETIELWKILTQYADINFTTIDREDFIIFNDIPIQDIIGKSNYSELELFENPFFDSELQYSLQDILDDILDLKLINIYSKVIECLENSLNL